MDKLRGMKLPPPRFVNAPMPEDLSHVNGYRDLQTFFPTLNKVFRLNKFQSQTFWLDTPMRISKIDCSGTSGPCEILLVDGSGNQKTVTSFMKVTHLLDPVRWMRGTYSLPRVSGLPWHSKTWTNAWHKLQDPWNQAYVECLATYALSKLVERNLTPHFNQFYGSFCSMADVYRYSINDEYQSFRNTRWFWKGKENGLYSLDVVNSEVPGEPVPASVVADFLTPPDMTDEEEEDEDEEEIDAEEIEADDGSLHSASMDDKSFEDEDEDEEDEEEGEDQYKIYAKLPNFPVMMIFTESNTETMDFLLNPENCGMTPGTAEWETTWSAWIFQAIAACCVMQNVLGMTHNDLHTNNIVWTKTDVEFLYYRSNSGEVWKVPTFGRLFRIIDFGRSIFSVNGKMFVSDDFRSGNDAASQYSFKPLVSHPSHEVPPNPSFDLSRLSVSLFEALYPEKPADSDSKKILSEEEGLVVRETVSPLYNILWTWLVDDEDRNILMEPDGSERFPDFDLYKHIAEHIQNARPSEQIHKAPFSGFKTKEVPPEGKAYPLFS